MKKMCLKTLLVLGLVFSLQSCFVSKKHHSHTHECPILTIGAVGYWASPCRLEFTVRKNGPDAEDSVQILCGPADRFSASIYGSTPGFPTYGLMTDWSSNGYGAMPFKVFVRTKQFTTAGVYTGKMKVHIYHGSETGFDTNFVYIPVKVTVRN